MILFWALAVMDFPILKTKVEGLDRKFNLSDPKEREEYFEAKAGPEIKRMKEHLDKGKTFIAYFLGKKNSGKGTYSKLFMEAVGKEKVAHISIGDVVRKINEEILESEEKKQELIKFLEKNYRGYISIDEALKILLSRDTRTLLPTEFILALVKKETMDMGKKSLFIDGFPRGLDQISYSLFFRDLINYREDPDVFVLIDVPEAVIDERIKYRRVCPKCKTPRNLKLFTTQKVDYDGTTKEFHLICDNPECDGARMVAKEGDELGIEPIRERLELDEKLIKRAFSLHGIPKVLLRNSIPENVAKEYVDDYEITPEYVYEWDAIADEVKVSEKPWTIKDDNNETAYSLLAPPVTVSLIKQLVNALDI